MHLKMRKYRESEGLTQKQFAKAIGKSIGTIQSWERGDSFPNAEAVWDMCIFFGTLLSVVPSRPWRSVTCGFVHIIPSRSV